jgi:hypothetical protein
MVGRKAIAKKAVVGANGSKEVDDFMTKLEHPLKAEFQALRAIILGADKRIEEGIKWNAPSFYFKDYFATINLRSMDRVQVILHQGAKVKDNTKRVKIKDQLGILTWVATERCIATLTDLKDIKAKKNAFADIVRQWIKQM